MQAGTGTGKTLAYLVPAIESGARVVVATATKALQDQLAGKDLPFLSRRLPDAVRLGRAQGTQQLRLPAAPARAGRAAAQGAQLELEGMAATTQAEIARIAEWVGQHDDRRRRRARLGAVDAAWRAVSVGSDECPGADRCPLGEPCFAEQARRRAGGRRRRRRQHPPLRADVGSGGVILPEHDVVVFDEAHVLEDVMSDTVGVQLAPGRFVTLGRRGAADPRRPGD